MVHKKGTGSDTALDKWPCYTLRLCMRCKNAQWGLCRSEMHCGTVLRLISCTALKVADRQIHCASFVGTLSGDRATMPQTFWAVCNYPKTTEVSFSLHWCCLNAWRQKWGQVKRQQYRKIFQIWVTEVVESPAPAMSKHLIRSKFTVGPAQQLFFCLFMCLGDANSSLRPAWYKCWATRWAEVSTR